MLKQGETTHMQSLQMLKTILKPKYSVVATLVMVGVVASVMGLAPTHGATNTLAQDCANPPSTPTFNYWPVTYDSVNTPFCHDFRAIDAAVDANSPQWSQSEADWQNGLNMTAGQQGVAGIYIHNGAANNLPISQTTAKNVHIITHTDTTVGTDHQISVTFRADNAPTYSKSFTVHTPANSQLQVIPNTGFMYDYQGRVVLSQQNLNLGNSDYTLGNLDACFEYSLFLTFKFKVIQTNPGNPTLTVAKTVKNNTTGTGYVTALNASKNDKVGYKIIVTNNGTQTAHGVTVTDNGVNGISVDSGSTQVNTSSDLWRGQIPGTINLGDLQPGQSREITYTGTVTLCSTSLVNTATAVASDAASVSSSASVIVASCNTDSRAQISITKQVKNNTNGGSYTDSVNAKVNDSVNFKIVVTNTGNVAANNVVMTDEIPSALRFADSVSGDGSPSLNGSTLTANFGSIAVGQSRTVEFAAKAITSCNTAVNRASATSSNAASVSATASVVIDNCGGGGSSYRLAIAKQVKNNTNGGSYSDSVSARNGDRVNFKVVVTNNGNTSLSNVVMTDSIPSGLQFDDSVSGDGTPSINGNTFTVNFGTLSTGSSKTVEFAARVTASNSSNQICNIAKATANNVGSVQDDACVNLNANSGNPNIVLSKRAFNDTKNVDATSVNADRGNYITYVLTTTNNGGSDATNYVIRDDLSQVLPLADIVSTNGATVSGNVISFPSMTIHAGETVTKTFQVRVKQSLSSSLAYQMTNTYGNTVVVRIPGNTVYVAPKTGAAGTSAVAFAGLLTAGFIAVRKRESIFKFIMA